MDKKGSRIKHVHAERYTKRQFKGNRYTVEQGTSFTSTSAEKLQNRRDMDVPISKEFGYCILNFFSVFSAIASSVICKICKKNIKFYQTANRGLGFKIVMQCKCGEQLINSCPLIDKAFEINRRIVFIMRLLGIGREGINLFCGLMDFSQGLALKTYYACLENIHLAASSVYDSIIKSAVEEEKTKNAEAGNPENNLTVSGDGTWKKRGFSSLFGVTTLIGKYSKKVLDTVVKSSFCQACNMWKNKKNDAIHEFDEWYKSHEENCTINHIGSAGKMEIDAVTEMFLRSTEKHGVKYATYIGDGDSKTFKGILDVNPYGEELIVRKKECVGHVEKRMGTRLRNVKKANKGIDGKGAGKLTDKVIGELTKYYGLAIRRHPHSVAEMKKAIWATYYHKSSTDEKPQHMYCPSGSDSWCKWRKAEANNALQNFSHDQASLNDTVLKVIKPIYETLSSDDLLERCLGAATQNSNESLNSLIWTFAPKHIHSGPKTVEIATFLAVIIFNEGFLSILKTLSVMGVTIGQQAQIYANSRDESRIDRSEKRSTDVAKKARIATREEKSAEQDFFEHEEGPLYGPELADLHKYRSFINGAQNFKRVFLKTMFFELMSKISQDLFDRLSPAIAYILSRCAAIAGTRIK